MHFFLNGGLNNRTNVLRSNGIPFLSKVTFLEGEMVVLDDKGNAEWVDVILEQIPDGEPLCKFMDRSGGHLDDNSLYQIFVSLRTFYEDIYSQSVVPQRIKLNDVFIKSSISGYNLVLTNFRANYRQKNDYNSEYLSAVILFSLFANEPSLYHYFCVNYPFNHSNIDRFIRLFLSQPYDFKAQPLMRLSTLAISDSREPNGLPSIVSDLGKLPVSIESLAKSLNNAASTPKMGKINTAAFSFVGATHHGLVSVCGDGVWRYLREDGSQPFEGEFLSATDFSNGHAVVETEQGFGLIDTSGNYAIAPQHEEVCWDSNDSLVRVMNGGYFALYNDKGSQLTEYIYDTIWSVSCGLLLAQHNGLYGYINMVGERAIDFIFDEAYSFNNDHAIVDYLGESYEINCSGNLIK